MHDLYDTRSVDDLGEILCSVPDHPPQPCPKQQLHDIAERVLGSEYTVNLPPAMPETT
jgi:hypothetical protein